MEEERLTKEHYAIAEKNGIHRKLARNRWDMGWSIERAITEPRQVGVGLWPTWKEIALANGINEGTFGSRVRKGIPPEEAANTPLQKFNSKLPRWIFDKAKENGIGRHVLSCRIHNYHWDWERACTEPVGKRGGNRK